jgi:hypothetical protein
MLLAIGGAPVKLFVSAFLLAAATIAFGQNQNSGEINGEGPVAVHPDGPASPSSRQQWVRALGEQGAIAAIQSDSQMGCPVVLTSARLNRPTSYLPVTSAEKVTEPNLALGFRNSSGKVIESVTIAARLLGKQNLYQLDADAFDLRLTFSGVDAADKAAEQLREISVPDRMHAYGVQRVSLEQVLFADGTFWTAAGHANCRLDVSGAERVAK